MKAEGFSVLELIVMLAIAALILGIMIFRTQGVNVQQRMDTAKGDLLGLEKAINAYYLNHKEGEGHHMFPAGADWQSGDLVNDGARVLSHALYDPFQTGRVEYNYRTSPSGKYYVVFSVGPDGVAQITGIDDRGELMGSTGDDLFISNGIN